MKKIVIVAFDDFTDIDLFFMWDILGHNHIDWQVKILGNKSSLRSAHGLNIHVQGALSEANSADAVLFSSGKNGVPKAIENADFLSEFKLNPEKQYIGSICAGTLILNALNLLPERRATTHPDARNALLASQLEPVGQPLVCHGRVATAGGCLSALYLVGWLIESLYDKEKRRETLLPVLPTGQQSVLESLIEFSIQQGRM
ncbi:DJ-1/PfpI family protein [Providencia huaxiensis]|uniref:DJ-1/PfpI family protein n=1 Tax=Providencia huaxiensis TaxID=2027290 RepID=UPI0034DCDA84